jgi:hypothetical protein
METFTKHFTFRGDKAFPTNDLFLAETGWVDNPTLLEKSSAQQVSEYKIYVRTFNSNYSYKLRNFSVNEMEADFNIDTAELKSVTFRDTSVHKKITFTPQTAVLTVVKGMDTVGQNSESIASTVKEPIIALSVNGKELRAPFDLNEVYTTFTGLDVKYLTEEEIEEEKLQANLWAELAEQLKAEGLIT